MGGDPYTVSPQGLHLKGLLPLICLIVCTKSFGGPLDQSKYSWAGIALFGTGMEGVWSGWNVCLT